MKKIVISTSVWNGYRKSSLLTCIGLSLRELIREFKYQTLILFKCCLLQPKVTDIFESIKTLLKILDAFLWLTMRAIMHDAIFFNLLNTRPYSKSSRLCRPRAIIL